jgi:SAM-dependent methyltransferase
VRSTAERYDWELRHVHGRVDQDVAFYRRWGRPPVLELACGTGRVASRLPEAVGLDRDADMLRAARARGVACVQGDMRRFAFACRFGLVAVPYNSLQLLSFDDAVACLACARAHLADDGVVAFEATDFAVAGDVGPERLASAEGLTLTGWVTVEGDWLRYGRRFEEDGEAVEDEVRLRRAGASTAEALVAAAGLRMVAQEWAGLALRVVAAPTLPA